MMQTILVGLVGGVAAALLFVAPFAGTPLGAPLFALTGLPIAIAGFGWGAIAVLLAAVVGVAGVAALAKGTGAVIFALIFAVPVAWATLVATQTRPGAAGRETWRPIGIVLTNAAAAVALGVIAIGVILGFDPAALVSEVTAAMVDWATTVNPGPAAPPTAADIEPIVRLNVALLPASSALMGVALVVLDLYLGAMAVRFSDRLKRAQEPMWSVSLPTAVPALFVVATLLAFAPGNVGYTAQAVAGALGCAVALVGLAVIHAMTRGLNSRGPILAAVYVALALVVLSGVPVILLALLGIAESIFHFRARRLRPPGPNPT